MQLLTDEHDTADLYDALPVPTVASVTLHFKASHNIMVVQIF